VAEAQGSVAQRAGALWRQEPFRVFFPTGVVLAWVGIGHWVLYATGVTATYSCLFHGLVQMQAFMMAFAVGFLFTALPRRTQTAAPTIYELVIAAGALVGTTVAAAGEEWVVAEISYVAVWAILVQFAVRRFVSRAAGRRPPAAFVLIPFALLHGLCGAGLIIASTFRTAPGWTIGLGRLLVEQGVFLCLAVGIGSLVLPLMAGTPPPPDLGASSRERWTVFGYGVAGIMVFVSFLLEQGGFQRSGPLLRAAVVAAGLGVAGGAWRAPGKSGLHRRLVWLSVWLIPAGLVTSALWPAYRIPALHILFIGGFSLMAFGVATHVALAHLDLQELALGSPAPVVVLGVTFTLALLARLAADLSDTYFDHLGWAAALWLVGSAVWLISLGPKLLRPSR
jgi:hypothetical protein